MNFSAERTGIAGMALLSSLPLLCLFSFRCLSKGGVNLKKQMKIFLS